MSSNSSSLPFRYAGELLAMASKLSENDITTNSRFVTRLKSPIGRYVGVRKELLGVAESSDAFHGPEAPNATSTTAIQMGHETEVASQNGRFSFF